LGIAQNGEQRGGIALHHCPQDQPPGDQSHGLSWAGEAAGKSAMMTEKT
jgi:hypothetical protein